MKPSVPTDDLFSLERLTSSPDYGARLLDVVPAIGGAASAAAAVSLFRQALWLMGADAGVLLSVIRDDAEHTSYRSLLACDPQWAIEYERRGWRERDPWLRHAMQSTLPIRASELNLLAGEEDFASTSSRLGFASTIVVPAPSNAGPSRIGVLYLGSHTPGFFDGNGYPKVRMLAAALALELHHWLLQAMRRELLAVSGIKPAEIDLLRHEVAGHTSKMIGEALNIEATAVDCRFQRLSAKLDVPDRRTAARVAQLYGLL